MDSLKCSKCITFLSKNNIITFSCSHILCKECIFHSFFKEQFSILKNLIYTNKIKIDCPICQKGNIELDSNIFLSLLNIKETENLENKVKNPNCKMHKNKSEFYCEQCSQYYCNECIKIHNEIGNSHHKLVKERNEISELKCQIHEMKINNFCIKCNELVCNCCISFNHSQHKISKLSQFVKDCNNNINFFKIYNWDELIKKKLSSNNDFENVFKETLENSVKQIDELIQYLNSFKEEYIQKMEQIHLTQININKILILSYDKIKIEFEQINNFAEFKKVNQLYQIIFLNDVCKMFKDILFEKKNSNVIEKEFYSEESYNNFFKNKISPKDEFSQRLGNYNMPKSFLSRSNSNNQNNTSLFPNKIETYQNSISERNK
jgi:hypothetical protein